MGKAGAPKGLIFAGEVLVMAPEVTVFTGHESGTAALGHGAVIGSHPGVSQLRTHVHDAHD